MNVSGLLEAREEDSTGSDPLPDAFCSGSAPVVCAVITDAEQIASDAETGWATLAGETGLYFHDPRYVRWRFRSDGGQRPFVVVARSGERTVAIVPFFVAEGKTALRLGLLTLARVKLRRLVVNAEAILAHPGCNLGEVMVAALSCVSASVRANVVEVRELECDRPLAGALLNAIKSIEHARLLRMTPPQPCHTLDFSRGSEAYYKSLGSKNRTNLNRRKKRLWEHFGGDVELLCIRSETEVESFLCRLDGVASKAWQAQVYGSSDRTTESQVEYYRLLARTGWLRSYLLVAAGQTLAFQVGVQDGTTYHFLETGYDPSYASLGPGTVLEWLVVNDLLNDAPPERGDFGFGDAAYKRTLCTDSHTEFEAVTFAIRSDLRALGLMRAQAALDRVETGVRQLLRLSRLEGLARRLVKRQSLRA